MDIEKINIKAFVAEHLGKFKPHAYFNKHLDCVHVEFQDCTQVEVRINRFISIGVNRNRYGLEKLAGFSINGIAYFFNHFGLPPRGIPRIVRGLNWMLEVL